MAEVTKSSARVEIVAPASSPRSGLQPSTVGLSHIGGITAGEAIAAGDACYLKSDGSGAWRATGAAALHASPSRFVALHCFFDISISYQRLAYQNGRSFKSWSQFGQCES